MHYHAVDGSTDTRGERTAKWIGIMLEGWFCAIGAYKLLCDGIQLRSGDARLYMFRQLC